MKLHRHMVSEGGVFFVGEPDFKDGFPGISPTAASITVSNLWTLHHHYPTISTLI